MKDKLGAAGFWGALILVLAMIGLTIWFPARGKAKAMDNQMGVNEQLKRVLPSGLRFTNETGEKVLLSSYLNKGRPLLLVPMFYDCKGACMAISEATIEAAIGIPQTTGTLYDIVVFSLDPTETSVDALKRRDYMLEWYGKKTPRPNAEKGWHCLVGDEDSIKSLTDSIGYKFTRDKKTGLINHPAAVVVVSPEGIVSQYFYGTEYPSKLVAQSLNAAKENKIENLTQQRVLIGCFQYNPITKQYVLVASDALKWAAISMVIATFLGIMYLSIRYRTTPVPANHKVKEEQHGE
ncbi:MAG: SCO family protein [Chthonomonas sp.]|nr:SCO family protein [Chthonomonas sp.]